MATARSQRIGIWIIAIVLFIGTLASFLALILAPQNAQSDEAQITALTTEYQNSFKDYQLKVDTQAAQLSASYFETFNQYASRVAVFNATNVTTLKTEDLKIGDGAQLTSESSFTAYYIGWNPDGVVFDGSIDGATLKAPFTAQPGSVITGWTEGINGMNIGGVRELTIPSDKAYGERGSGDKIAANTPLKFVIMTIPTPETIAQPEVPAKLLEYYSRQRN